MDGDALNEMLEVETSHVEWKESYRNNEPIYRAVAAFANDLSGSGAPGHILIGVDRHGTVVGLPWTSADERDKGLQELAGLFRQIKIVPNPSVDVEALEVHGKVIAWLRVSPYAVPPVVKVDGVAWVRVGTTTQRATEADLSRLEERRPENTLPFDRRVVPSATLEDLDLGSLRARWMAAREGDVDRDTFPEFEPWLSLEDMVRRTPQGWSPTVTGVLLQGRKPLFDLRASEGIGGGQLQSVARARLEFADLSRKIATGLGLDPPSSSGSPSRGPTGRGALS